MIRKKQPSPAKQGFADYCAGVECPYPTHSHDAQEWELGWLAARRAGAKGPGEMNGLPESAWRVENEIEV